MLFFCLYYATTIRYNNNTQPEHHPFNTSLAPSTESVHRYDAPTNCSTRFNLQTPVPICLAGAAGSDSDLFT